MRIKKFNEDKLEQWEITDIYNDINDILDNYTTYLVDNGFKFKVHQDQACNSLHA